MPKENITIYLTHLPRATVQVCCTSTDGTTNVCEAATARPDLSFNSSVPSSVHRKLAEIYSLVVVCAASVVEKKAR